MRLVSTWLNGIGLNHVIPNFREQAITTPSALSNLELVDYESLGISDPSDKKKLFYLIQRIKMAQIESEGGGGDPERETRKKVKITAASARAERALRERKAAKRRISVDTERAVESSAVTDAKKRVIPERDGRRRIAVHDDASEDYEDAYDNDVFEEGGGDDDDEDEEEESVESVESIKYDDRRGSAIAASTAALASWRAVSGDDRDSSPSPSRIRFHGDSFPSDSSSLPSPPNDDEEEENEEEEEAHYKHNNDSYMARNNEREIRKPRRSMRIHTKQHEECHSFDEPYSEKRADHKKEKSRSPHRLRPQSGSISPYDEVNDDWEDEYSFDKSTKPSKRSTTKLPKKNESIKNNRSYSQEKKKGTRSAGFSTRSKSANIYEKDDSSHDKGIVSSRTKLKGSNLKIHHKSKHSRGNESSNRVKIKKIKDSQNASNNGLDDEIYDSEDVWMALPKENQVNRPYANENFDLGSNEEQYTDDLYEEESPPPRKPTRSVRQSTRRGRQYTSSEDEASTQSFIPQPTRENGGTSARKKNSPPVRVAAVLSASAQKHQRSKDATNLKSKQKTKPGAARSSPVPHRKSISDCALYRNDSYDDEQYDASVVSSSLQSIPSVKSKEIRSVPSSTSSRNKTHPHFDEEEETDTFPSPTDNGFDHSTSSSTRTNSSKSTTKLSRRHRSKIPNLASSGRNGLKRLSTIPSGKELPMSPLLKATFDNNVVRDEIKKEKASSVTNARREGSTNQTRGRSGSGECTSSTSRERRTKTATTNQMQRRSSAPLISPRNNFNSPSNESTSSRPARPVNTRNCNTEARLRRRSHSSSSNSSRKSTGRVHRDLNTSSSIRSTASSKSSCSSRSRNDFDRSRSPSRSPSRSRNASANSSSGAVFVHGLPEDDSWGAQVTKLREDTEDIHRADADNCAFASEIEDMRIRVVIRKRPMSKREANNSTEEDVIHPLQSSSHGKIFVYQPKTRVDLTKEIETLKFAYDNVFCEKENNVDIYRRAVHHLIPGAFEGQWGSVFAYGQTGSGKTFTMMGNNLTGSRSGTQNTDDANSGLYYLAAKDLFRMAKKKQYKHMTIGASLFEIYSNKLFDLVGKRKQVKCLEDHKGRVCFPGLTEYPIQNADQLLDIIETGATNRSTGSTSANADSSRSHAVLCLSIRKTVGRKKNVEHGRLTFIDLAGSERGADTSKASRTTRLEGAEINTSLLALKEVIRALATGGSMTHIPFRGSKLTQVLKESFIGPNTRTVMVACVAPNMGNVEHTLNTLRYADRVKERDAENGKASTAVVNATKRRNKQLSIDEASLQIRPTSAPEYITKRDKFDDNEELSDAVGISHMPREELDSSRDNVYKLDEDSEWSSEETGKEDDERQHQESVMKQDYDVSDGFESTNEETNEEESCPPSPPSSPEVTDNELEEEEIESVRDKFPPETTQRRHNDTLSSSVISPKKVASQKLISSHRAIMTEMLVLVKHEMLLVNCTDADRDKIDDYLTELDQLQEKQLSMIATLRESLLEYYALRDKPNFTKTHGRYPANSTLSAAELSDETFEDLRD